MSLKICGALGGVCVLALPAAAPAQTQPSGELEEVVVRGELGRYSATKSDTPIVETARSVSVETRLDLLDKGALELADAYLYSAGAFGERYGFATRGDWVAVRGFDVPEYRDSLQALFGHYNNTRPDVYTIEQVEVLKGPASVLYGQGAPGGIVNVVSKTPQEEPVSELVAELGRFNRQQVAGDFGAALDADGRWLYRVNAVYRDTETQVDHVDEKSVTFAPSVRWRPAEETNLTLLLNMQQSDSDTGAQFHPIQGTLEPAPNGRFIAFDTYLGEPEFNRYDTENHSLTLLADHQLSSVWSLEATARYTEGESDYRQAWPAFIGGDRYVYDDDGSLYENGSVPRTFYIADNRSEQLAVDARARASFSTGGVMHEVLMGAMYQDVTTESDTAYMYALGYDFATAGADDALGDRFWINVFDPVYTGAVPDQALVDQYWNDAPPSTTRDSGFYVNDEISAGPWRMLLGVRYDEVKQDTPSALQSDYATSYSGGLLYQFDNGLAPYVSYAESFEPVVGTDQITGDLLQPREGEQIEAGLKYQRRDGPLVTLAWFDITETNRDNPNSLVGAPSQQEGEAHVDGVELEAFTRFGEFAWEVNASLVNSENPDGYRFASVPERQASTWLSYRPRNAWEGFKAGVGLRYVGESFDGADDIRTPSYTLADLMIGYQTGTWNAMLNARNVTDKKYMATCLSRGDCFLGERRSIVGKLAWRF